MGRTNATPSVSVQVIGPKVIHFLFVTYCCREVHTMDDERTVVHRTLSKAYLWPLWMLRTHDSNVMSWTLPTGNSNTFAILWAV